MVREIEKSILYVVHNAHFTANELAVCSVFYNERSHGITISKLAILMDKSKQGEIGGILSALAQKIDRLETPSDQYGFSGYLLFFERFDGDLHKIRPEFRHIIDQHPVLKGVMNLDVKSIISKYPKGLSL